MMIRNILLTFCLTVYCSLIFSSTIGVVSTDGSTTKSTYSQEAYLSELSKIIFPQTVNPNGYGGSLLPSLPELTPEVDPVLCGIQLLNNKIGGDQAIYLKEVEHLVLKFTPTDIIYPYHGFW